MIQVIHRALNILEYLSTDAEKEFRLSEIADELKLNHGTCANILKTLTDRNYVEQAEAKKGYKLGYMSYKLGNSDSYNRELTDIAKEFMDELGKELNEVLILSVIKNDKRLVLYETFPDQELQVHTKPESSIYKATTARTIIAYYSPKELNDLIERIGLPSEEDWPEIKTKENLQLQLDVIRKNNMEIYCNKNHIISIGAPIFKNNKVVASLGIYLPEARYGNNEKKRIPTLIRDISQKINNSINLISE